MKRLPVLLLIACALLACSPEKKTVIYLDFEITRLSPFLFSFTNLSTGYDSYKWDFGDGTFSFATDEALHDFEVVGTYTVTLIATVDGVNYERRKTVEVTKPDIYFAGYTIYSIPYQNRYYKLVFKDDNLLPSSWDFKTAYTPMLDDTYLPYTRMFTTPVLLENIGNHTYYTIQVIRTTNASNTSNDINCMKQQLKVKDILNYLPEYILQTETGNTAIGIHMLYDY